MRLHTLLVAALLLTGCSAPAPRIDPGRAEPSEPRVAPSTTPAPATRRGPYTLRKGQRYRDAQASARAAGYRLHDGRGLAWMTAGPQGHLGVDGFYLRLPGDTDLIVFRDRQADTVSGLHLVGNASKPKAFRTRPPVGEEFDLPAPDDAGR